MSIAIYPGSFDPVTTGHVNLIERASKIFDHVIVCVLINSGKKTPLFSIDERVNMLECVTEGFHNVSVRYYDGLLVDFAKQEEAFASYVAQLRFANTPAEQPDAEQLRMPL